MKKIERLLALLLVICLAAGGFTACSNEEEPEQTAYVFTLVDEDGNPVVGAMLNLCDTEGAQTCYAPMASDAEGKVTYTYMPDYGVYEIHLTSVPDGYGTDFEGATKTSADVHAYTLVVKKNSECQHSYVGEYCIYCGAAKTYTWTVKLIYQDDVENADGTPVADESLRGQPIAGVSMLILSSDGGSMVTSGTTDENGEFSFVAPMDVAENEITCYKIYLQSGIPEGYYTTMDGWSFVAGSTTCTVTVWDEDDSADGTAFNQKKITIGKTTQITLSEARVDSESTSYDGSLYYVSVKPSKQTDVGYYSLTISNLPEGVTVYVGQYPSTTTFVSGVASISASGQGTVTLNFNMEEKYMKDSEGNWTYPNSYTFGIRVEGDATYPVSLDVTVTRERDLIAGVDYAITERTYVQIEENPPAASAVLGDVTGKTLYAITLTAVRDDSGVTAAYQITAGDQVLATIARGEDGKFDVASALVQDADGYYHIGSAEGPLLLLNVTKGNPLLDSDAEMSFLTVNSESGTQNLLYSWTVKEEIDGLIYTTNYVNYYSTMLESYGALCGTDGAYPVNDQLLDFLVKWTDQRANTMITGGYGDCAFLLGCVAYI